MKKYHQPNPRFAAFGATMLLLVSTSMAATTELSQSYRPTGADFTITALQNLTPITLGGGTSVGANPNLNFEFQNGIGVTYNNGSKSTDFGIGLYDSSPAAGTQLASTGLNITYDTLVTSNGLNITLGDFDVTKPSDLFNKGKVAPTLTIYGAGNSVLGTFTAAQLIPEMTLLSANDPIAKVDTWNLNIGALLPTDTAVSGFTLAADTTNGKGVAETTKSDPYFIANLGNGTPVAVPEPGSALLVMSAALGTLITARRRR